MRQEQRQSWRAVLLIASTLGAWGCSASDGNLPLPIEEPGGDTTVNAPVGTTSSPSLESPSLVGAGNIKSYFEETEMEPPFLTGSLFANGFSLDSGGMGGSSAAVTVHDPVEQLGLGTGDLTVLVLFDRSVSMSDQWEGQPRWKVAGRAFMNGMAGYEESVTLGAIFFPQAAECDVAPLSDPRQIQFQAGTRFKQHWEAFPQNRFPSGGTPLGPAFEEANAVIEEVEDYGLIGPGRRFRVAVVTDGKPNCGTDPERVFFLARNWVARGVEISVIGLPGSSEAATFLDELAQIGGANRHVAPVDQNEAESSFAVVVK